MPVSMRAVDVKDGAGPASALFINDAVPVPEVMPGECLVKIKAFGINRGDILQRDGKYPGISHLTKIMGLEFSGVIAHLNAEEDISDGWRVGDEVFGLLYGGGYAEYVNVDRRMLIRKPKELSFEQLGGLCETWFTALQALHFVGQYSPETTRSILWHAGASAVSVAGIQLSRNAHLITSSPNVQAPKVFATARTQDKCNFAVNELGATCTVNLSHHPDKRSWADDIKAKNGGQGVDLVIDFLGGPYLQSNLDVLALDGCIVQLGWLDGPVSQGNLNIAGFLTKRARVQGSQLRSRSLEYQIKLRDFFEANVLPGLVDGRFKHVVERVIPWERVAEAHQLLEGNRTKGKVVCVVG
ncbi:oxidoreductase, zinc-binding dehydrogenase family protein [Metarhizium album ARSEF 1941]|uniref:Oxidoreductase, zinc-binding dehydrogenase family protein n=1 Tax=Metarhizium album (strain ARSEF 1941) TaxID=1081103 RepID=A0A0B2WN40_METAS|nr:oxidoreductase, zinc-binding dehydrogenase family protein [Metarhizium album ARSEF 1941]KHN94907.1 oxidoreductase, zinc-binding dehydrogenase family protein [Metarhizium album ARSEF 1941]